MSSSPLRPSLRARAGRPSGSMPRYGLARVLSKRGACSRSQAERAIREGRVQVGGQVVRDPEFATDPAHPDIRLDGAPVDAVAHVHIALNKPRGVVTTASDERGRATVYDLLRDSGLPWVGPVGRLDRASEGLLLLSNDTAWAAGLTEPRHHVDKTYHVQVDGMPDSRLLQDLQTGVVEQGEHLRAKHVALLRHGGTNAWLEVVLDEGRNRHIRRLLASHGLGVRRLVRVAIGSLQLGDLPKGQWRRLSADEVRALDRR